MIAEFVALTDDVEALKTAIGGSLEVGAVEEIDAVKGYRLRLGDDADGGAYLSPWYPHPETGKTSVPLKKGQIVGRLNPTGDDRQGFLVRGGYSDAHKSPNDDMTANVFEDAGVRVEIGGRRLIVTIDDAVFTLSGQGLREVVGGVEHLISSQGIRTIGGTITHDGKNVGSSHLHSGVVVGGSLTEGPV